jgi:transcriptional regulator with XRE-family HTH domain
MIESFPSRLRRMRLDRGLTQQDVASIVGKSRVWVTQIESEARWKDKLPPHDDLRLMARALHVSVGVLAGDEDEDAAMQGASRTVSPIRRLSEAELFERFGIKPYDQPLSVDGLSLSAGSGAGVPQGIDDTLPRKVPGRRYLWEAPVVGDCMEDEIHPGEVVIYSTRLGAELGKIMVALRDEEELLIKRLVVHNGAQILRPNRGDDVPVDERIRFLGRGVSVQRSLL